jgi:hypothetical protein
MKGVEHDRNGGESIGAVVEASRVKIELLKRRAHNLFKEQSHLSSQSVAHIFCTVNKCTVP